MTKPLTLLIALAASLAAVTTQAGTIDLRLDVNYTGANPSAGGTWKLFAKTDEFGLFSLTAPLSGINASVTNELPRGRVNGSATNNAGFSLEINRDRGSYRQLTYNQQITPAGAGQQGVFYGVGTLDNGSPNFPGRVANTNFLGPNITSLTSVQDVPWALEDPLWATGVTVASGSFAAGATPAFATATGELQGSLLTSIGSISTPGDTTLENTINTSVRTNLGFGVATGDYTGDGRVDAADYTFWRDRLNQTVPALTSADGNGDGVVNGADWNVWRNNYGTVSAPAAAVSIPEPASVFLTGFSLLLLARRRRASCGRRGNAKLFGGIA
ncbi:dockerin type I repeat-containing protein [Botrimarina mediterranea]|uniref:PEP-CTERM protein-sorting domain-containing protein n=1 Tax=Botrimarina mediterranea TaxID=2528022 RepID=A0A518KDR4_9BACT|nr:dockerin type I repeat-containing protein [Botrimarina mediterranea]QDV75925.1 hypothetical protein Spa11_41480 [Botrimarina mediterranea]QDV80520.1 hypothetical protein K2D_41490 [Planctomycetes bacterium K2D]